MKAHELLSDRSKWTQGELARNCDGCSCDPESDEAVAFCAIGALVKCYGHQSVEYYENLRAARRNAAKLFHEEQVMWVNDEIGYEAVMRVLRETDV